MTTGQFATVIPSFIWVDDSKRQRKELTKIDELAESIRTSGLIHPPVIKRDGELIVGRRRLEAVRLLGWTQVPIQWIDDLDEAELRKVELEENTRRVDISWQEDCLGVHEYNEVCKANDPTWTQEKTAEALGLALRSVVERLSVARELLGGNTSVNNAPLFSTAKNIVARKAERARAAELEVVRPKVETPIITTDFHKWVSAYDGPKFNLIHCDFPYGIGAHKMDLGSDAAVRIEYGDYSDTAENYMNLLASLRVSMSNVVDESAHLIFWFSMDYYEFTKDSLEEMGWRLDGRPLIWHKSCGTGVLPDHQRGPRWIYETAFFASRGDRKIVRAVANLCSAPVTKQYHMSEKPKAVLEHFFRMVCDEYTTLLDPTCGGGNAITVAKQLGAKAVTGLEQNAEFGERARENWRAAVEG